MSHPLPTGIRRSIAMALMAISTLVTDVADLRADGPSTRVPWTGSKLNGTPDAPPPYAVELAFPRLKHELPVALAHAEGSGRLFVGELHGRIVSFPNDPTATRADLAIDIAKTHPDFTALYGLAFHPKFDENRYLYVCYVRKNEQPDGSVVSRFAMSRTDPPIVDPASETVLLRFYSGGHNGGCLVFGKDGYLYISTGDAASPSPPDPMDTGQDCSDLLSSVLRIDVDRPDPGKPYGIPPDNPFVKTPNVRPEIWAFGFRNPWRMSIDRTTGDLWVGDVGWELWEMVHKVKRGGNYGWSVMEGPQPVRVESRRGPTPILPPLTTHPHSEAASITGGYVYHGTRLPELAGAYIYGDFQTGLIWGLRCDGDKITWRQELARSPLHLVAFGESRDGELFLIDHDRTHQVYRLVPNPVAKQKPNFPRRLSETGLFDSTRDHRMSPGVIGYTVNSELWADGATADRYLAVPGDGRVGLDLQGYWRFPEGSVLLRTVYVGGLDRKAVRRRRVETQVLHLLDNAWRPYSYVWNDDQADAVLADGKGTTLTIAMEDPAVPGGHHDRSYRVHARAECILCHNPWVEKKTTIYGVQSASPLGMNTSEMNVMKNGSGGPVDQLKALQHIGLLDWKSEPASLPRLVNPYDESASLAHRARSYLQTNCAHCHQSNAGGTANIALGFDVPIEKTQTVDVRPIQGTFNIAGARIIAPGEPSRSVLYYRVAKVGGGRMPRVGSNHVDERAARMIHDWIAAMAVPGSDASASGGVAISAEDRAAVETLRAGDRTRSEARTAAIRQLASTTRGALMLLGMVDRVPAPESLRREVVAITRASPAIEVRDLFERFIPEGDRVKRLGDVVDRPAILALRGDAARGRVLFATNPAAQCKTCHSASEVGISIGPDLAKIGAKYDRAGLLDQILEPSKTIDPQFVTYLLETKDGRVMTGLVVEKNGREVVLKDAQGKTVRIPGGDVEHLVPQSRSLMPELLLRDLTAQQVADLLEYLTSLR